MEGGMSKREPGETNGVDAKLSRRTFAKTSVAAGTAAVALPKTLLGSTPAKSATTKTTYGRAARVKMPEESGGYVGGDATPLTTPVPQRASADVWEDGLTLPAEYYLDPKHFDADEAFLAENIWQYTDQASRIPNPGDFYVFEFGRSESILIVRGQDNEIRGFHNVCRHRGSRLCRHDADAKPGDPRLSVKQLGQSGSSPVFRCPYHAWTYDTEGSLIYAYGMQDDFDPAENGLVPCHTRVAEGQVLVNLSKSDTPPDFESAVSSVSAIGGKWSLADLKVAAREYVPINANWKLFMENFKECYHCGPAHTNLVATHNWDLEGTREQKNERHAAVAAWVPEESRPGRQSESAGMGDTPTYASVGGLLNPGFVTGSVDGKPASILLPNITGWNHETKQASTGQLTGFWQAYDDHVVVARFTPRTEKLVDCETVWLVHPDAVEGRDYDPDNVKALWYITLLEDIWITDNNHVGIESGAYAPSRYSTHESGPNGFVNWYMKEIVKAGD
jgi:phenylpropionate dioxygenase-like ring-hydroxylating dioxygenase large terminal subunit